MCCRAPGVLDSGPSVEILAEYHLTPEEQKAQGGRESVAVAVRDKHLLATAFHPELTSDLRWYIAPEIQLPTMSVQPA